MPFRNDISSLDELREHYREGRRDFRGLGISDSRLQAVVFQSCDFSETRLARCTLSNCSFSGCVFTKAVVSETTLDSCTFLKADLSSTVFSYTRLVIAHFFDCTLVAAKFEDSSLHNCAFVRCNIDATSWLNGTLRRTSFSDNRGDRTYLDGVVFVGSQLNPFAESDAQIAGGGVIADWSSICRSLRTPQLDTFLARTGMPDLFVQYVVECARALDPDMLMRLMRSTFISYGSPDAKFARTLRDALHQNGVATYLFESDSTPGRKLHQEMRDGINRYDRVILVCSAASLVRPGVQNEIEECLSREARHGGEAYLIPVILDDALFNWDHRLARPICDRVAADFRETIDRPDAFATAFRRLLKALRS